MPYLLKLEISAGLIGHLPSMQTFYFFMVSMVQLSIAAILCLFFKLRKEFGPRITAKFPPRKLLSLTPVQVEERRAHLEKYLQVICQDPGIALSSVFVGFFLNAQKVNL